MENEITLYDALTGESITRQMSQQELDAINSINTQGADNDDK